MGQGYQHSMGVFLNKDNIRIFYRSWAAENPAGLVFLCHGLGEHSGRYSHLIQKLRDRRISFYALDHKGHGKSGGKRGHTERFTDYCQDIHQYITTLIRPEAPGLPLILLGHSMGGLIAALHARMFPEDIDGLILSSPAFMPSTPLSPLQRSGAKILARLTPRLSRSNKLSPEDLSSSRETVAAYSKDPLVHNRITFQWLVEFLAATRQCLDRGQETSLPLLIFHGGADAIVSAEGSRCYYERAKGPDKTLKIFDGLRHETMNESPGKREPVLNIVADWIVAHAKK
ncbi:MAG: lysophospholipase [Thermodesulfobacteriota bacterium]